MEEIITKCSYCGKPLVYNPELHGELSSDEETRKEELLYLLCEECGTDGI